MEFAMLMKNPLTVGALVLTVIILHIILPYTPVKMEYKMALKLV